MFHEATKKAYVGWPRLWEGSILGFTNIVTSTRCYSSKNTAEDSDFVSMLVADNLIYPAMVPHMYIYTIHESNTWGKDHGNHLCNSSFLLPPQVGSKFESILNENFSPEDASHFLDSKELLSEIRYI
jgi:hypothetical protein